MRSVMWALLLLSPAAFADDQNVYDFVFTGSIDPTTSPFVNPLPGCCVPIETFTLSFLTKSPTLTFPAANAPFSASLGAYDVNLVIGNQIVLQDSTGNFSFNGIEQLGYQPGVGASYIGGGWSFSSSALTWGGTPDFSLPFPDPLNGGGYAADDGVARCSLPGVTFQVLCEMGGRSVKVSGPTGVPEPGTLALLGLGLAGLFLQRRRETGRRRVAR